jgi:protein tyrosine phosphatase
MIVNIGWLNADPKNVAVVHCQTGNGRTSAAVAAYIAWAGLSKFRYFIYCPLILLYTITC